MIHRLTLRLSLWLGYRRQRIARLVRSADVKRGLAKSKISPGRFGPRSDGSEARPVNATKGL